MEDTWPRKDPVPELRPELPSPSPPPFSVPLPLSQKQITHTSLNTPKRTIYVHYYFSRVFCVSRIVIYYHNDPMKEVLLSPTSSWRKKPTQRREGRSSQHLSTPSQTLPLTLLCCSFILSHPPHPIRGLQGPGMWSNGKTWQLVVCLDISSKWWQDRAQKLPKSLVETEALSHPTAALGH